MTIHAYTEPSGPYPAYINLSGHSSHLGDAVVTVRSAGAAVASSIRMQPEQLRALANDIATHLDAGMRQDMAFGDALAALKAGKRVARAGWNGKGMFAYLVPANSYPAQTGAAKAHFGEGGMVPYNAYLALKGADDTVSTWAPSGSDALAEDWLVVESATSARPAHQQRVISERAELEERLGKLVAFTRTPIFAGLDDAERLRLDQQVACMAMYSDILADRIAAFAPAAEDATA